MLDLERRSAPRIDLQADVRLASNGDQWQGTALNVSLSGLYMVFPASVPVSQNQRLQLGLVSEISVLEITGSVLGIRELAQAGSPALGLAIKFSPLGSTEQLIFGSLLEGARECPVTLSFTGLLVPQETGDLLLEVNAPATGGAGLSPIHPSSSPSDAEDQAPPERRLTSRGAFSIPVHLRRQSPSSAPAELAAQAVDISLGGMSLRMDCPADSSAGLWHLRFFLPQATTNREPRTQLSDSSAPPAGEPDSECTVTAELVWTRPDPGAGGGKRQGNGPGPARVGLRFPYLDDAVRLRIAGLVAQLLTSSEPAEQEAQSRLLVSDALDCRNRRGQRLALYHDHRRDELPPDAPVVIISPGYGETKKEHIALAYYLAANAFHVLRYDHSNHVGESDGDIQHSTLSSMTHDLLDLLAFAEQTWPASPVAVVTTSLAGRVALKAVAQDGRIKLLVLLAGVVDVQATLLAVHQEDLIGTHLQGVRRGLTNVLGLNVDLDQWLEDAITGGYANLHTSIRDAEQVRTPVTFVVPEHDAWVHLESVKMIYAAVRSEDKHLYMIPEALHRLNENPRKARAVFRQLVSCCLDHFSSHAAEPEVREPSRREIGVQSRLERERARAQNQMAKTENVQFWREYLDQFHYIVNFSDYWHLLDHVYRLLGTFEGKTRVLDAGCGNGNFGMFLMINQAYSRRHAAPIEQAPVNYVGTDFVFNALSQARSNFANVAAESVVPLAGTMATPFSIIPSLTLSDLNMPLPFSDNQFNCIISNLVIGYLQDPLFTLRELMRVLSAHGKLIVTNLKPQADLSQIYRNFVRMTERPEEVDEARRLLNNSGKIKLGESDGIFRFFDRQELATLLISSGAQQPRIYSTFANQAFIAVATKPGASPSDSLAAEKTLTLPQIPA